MDKTGSSSRAAPGFGKRGQTVKLVSFSMAAAAVMAIAAVTFVRGCDWPKTCSGKSYGLDSDSYHHYYVKIETTAEGRCKVPQEYIATSQEEAQSCAAGGEAVPAAAEASTPWCPGQEPPDAWRWAAATDGNPTPGGGSTTCA